MAKTRPSKKKTKKEKSSRHSNRLIRELKEDPMVLYEQATALLQTGQPDAALELVERALKLSSENSPNALIGLNLSGEVHVELGNIPEARQYFTRAVQLDPEGTIPDSQGGGPEKFLWLAQLSEEGGKDSVAWFERGVAALRRIIQSLEESGAQQNAEALEERKAQMAQALCSVVEIYMTDLSWEEDAESRCEALVTEALMVAPDSPECLQTLASVRISQLRHDDARAALSRSMELWKDLPPEHPKVPAFASRISLARLLMEVQMEAEALGVLERMILEDDHSVETWYLGGWCQYLLGRKAQESPSRDASQEEQIQSTLLASRGWLKQSIKLYDIVDYEDEKLKEHALELIEELEQELKDVIDDTEEGDGEADAGNEDDWEDIEAVDSDDDHEMEDS
ncbi:hypothetical protein VTO42DRAFT_4213 [Malbranchea cinnamomea]